MATPFGVKRMVRHINRGGMGKVEEVELLDGTRAARKTFEPDKTVYSNQLEHDKLRKRFEREVKYQMELGRNGAMPILGSDLKADPPWFVMPLADTTYEQQIDEDRAANQISPQPLMDILSGWSRCTSWDTCIVISSQRTSCSGRERGGSLTSVSQLAS